MFKIDGLTKILLAVIALTLLALLFRGGKGVDVQPEAYAQNQAQPVRPRVQVVNIKDIPVKDFKEVILLGDGKTFLIRVDAGIGVYQVQEY